MNNRKVKVRSILFTEACPLSCRYCHLKDSGNYGKSPPISFETIKEKIALYDQQDDINEVDTRLLFTGGEPFLCWEQIKEIIDHYGHRFSYMFNTSGYLLTEEIIEYLAKYNTHFVLSIDGGQKLTNYLRPVNDSPYRTGYFKKLVEILPAFTYNFPLVPFRMIISPRYVDLVYDQYVLSDRLGFKYFTYVLDFESRPNASFNGKIWNSDNSDELLRQLKAISALICAGYQGNVRRPQVVQFNSILKYLFKNKEPSFSPKKYPCRFLDGRTLSTVHKQEEGYCMSSVYPNREDASKAILEAYEKTEHKCPLDKYCPAFEYCAQHCCPQYALNNGGFFQFDSLECVTHKCSYEAALYLLEICNFKCPNSNLYKEACREWLR